MTSSEWEYDRVAEPPAFVDEQEKVLTMKSFQGYLRTHEREEQYIKGQYIGKGSFGSVYLLQSLLSGKLYVLKVQSVPRVASTEKMLADIVNIVSNNGSPNTDALFASFTERRRYSWCSLNLVRELMFYSWIAKQPRVLAQFFSQLHDVSLAHTVEDEDAEGNTEDVEVVYTEPAWVAAEAAKVSRDAAEQAKHEEEEEQLAHMLFSGTESERKQKLVKAKQAWAYGDEEGEEDEAQEEHLAHMLFTGTASQRTEKYKQTKTDWEEQWNQEAEEDETYSEHQGATRYERKKKHLNESMMSGWKWKEQIIMDYTGISLFAAMPKMNNLQKISVLLQCLGVLHQLHLAGYWHLDIHDSNIMISDTLERYIDIPNILGLRDHQMRVRSRGVKITIIDYGFIYKHGRNDKEAWNGNFLVPFTDHGVINSDLDAVVYFLLGCAPTLRLAAQARDYYKKPKTLDDDAWTELLKEGVIAYVNELRTEPPAAHSDNDPLVYISINRAASATDQSYEPDDMLVGFTQETALGMTEPEIKRTVLNSFRESEAADMNNEEIMKSSLWHMAYLLYFCDSIRQRSQSPAFRKLALTSNYDSCPLSPEEVVRLCHSAHGMGFYDVARRMEKETELTRRQKDSPDGTYDRHRFAESWEQ